MEAWRAVDTQGLRCRSEAEAVEQVMALVRRKGAQRVLLEGEETPLFQTLAEALARMGVTVLGGVLPHQEGPRRERWRRWATAEVGITSVVAAFADTGSLWIAGGPGRRRAASLLPPVHIALVRQAQVYPSLSAWIQAARERGELARWLEQSSALIAITGPSRTADIEQTLTLGVHGPRELYALLVG